MAIGTRLRFEILRRDSHRCRYCGTSAQESELHVDHVIPEALGGATTPENLVTACIPCNRGKAATSPTEQLVADVAEDALRWARARQMAQDSIQRDAQALLLDSVDLVGDVCSLLDIELSDSEWECAVGSATTWIRRGLTTEEFGTLANLMLPKVGTVIPHDAAWRYFSACCWNRLRQIDDRATEILTTESGVFA